MSNLFLAITFADPGGSFASLCGIIWKVCFPFSGVAALVSAFLCPFPATACQARRLSRAALWGGAIAFIDAVVASLVTGGFFKMSQRLVVDAALMILLTGVAPTLAFLAGRVSRRKA